MSSSSTTFLLFLASVGLFLWRPQATGAKGLHLLLWSALLFFSSIALLFALFTVWWPPSHWLAVAWSLGALGVLALTATSRTEPRDWLP